MKKWIEITLGVIFGLLLIFRGTELWIGYKIKKIASTELEKATGGLYKLDIGRLSVGLFDRSIKIRDISLSTDSSKLEQIVMQADASDIDSLRRSDPYIDITVSELFAKGIRYKRRHADQPAAMQTIDTTTQSKIHSALSRSFERLRIGTIRIRGIDLQYIVRKGDDTQSFDLKHGTIETDNYDLAANSPDYPMCCLDIRMAFRKFEHTYQFGAMTMSVDTLSLSTQKKEVKVNSLRISPNYPKEEFAMRNSMHKDWTFFTLGAITVSGLDMQSLAYRKELLADNITIGKLDVGSYKNRNIEVKPARKYMFYESLQRLPLKVRVGSLRLMDGTAYYEERPVGSENSGTVRFTNLGCDVAPLTNMVDSAHSHIKLHATGRLMDAGNITVEFLAPVDSTDTRFEMTGSMGPMNMKAINPIIEPLGKVRIDGGMINSLRFNIAGNDQKSWITMTLRYNDLDIMLLKENKLGRERDRVFISALANDIFLRRSNPDKSGKLTTGSGATVRNIDRSQFNYIWKSIYTGVKSTIGIPDKF